MTIAGRIRRYAVGAAAIVGLATMLVTFTPLPGIAARTWAEWGRPRPAELIIVLGSGATWPGVLLYDSVSRLQHGVWLYHAGFAPRLVVSGGADPSGLLPSEGELMRRAALTMGVPAERIIPETASSRTYENGVEVAAIMRRQGWTSAILVTDAVHMRRARLVFERLGVTVYPSASHTVGMAANTPGRRLLILENVVYEALGLLTYRIKGWA